MKKLLCIVLVCMMIVSVAAVGVVTASAYGELAPGGFGTLGEYTPTAGVQTQKLMFAMPAAWQNDTTKNEKCGGAAGCYWWTGYEKPDDVAGGHGWPGYKAVKVEEYGVDNLWAIDVPTYGNGEMGNAYIIIWNNYLDGGMESDPVKNPFYNAAQQAIETPAQYYSRYDEHETYDMLFRYIYRKAFEQYGIDVWNLDIRSRDFWEQANMIAAAELGEDWYSLSQDEKTWQVDIILDELYDDLDLSEFGAYADNFFNEDLVGDAYYPNEVCNCFGESFTFDNMVYVVSFDPEKMVKSPVSGKISYAGDWYFYYGGGEYGSWPTKELNEQMKAELGERYAVSGNFAQGKCVDPVYVPPTPTDDPVTPVTPDPALNNPKYYPPATPQNYSSDKIYFYANPNEWHNYNYIYLYLYDDETGEMITWGSKKGKMTNEGNNFWSFDLDAKGFYLDPYRNYGCIFTADWGVQTCVLIIDSDNLGDVAYLNGNMVENYVDSNKLSYVVRWKSDKHGNPVTITSIGNVIGNEYWKGETAYSLFYEFISTTDFTSIKNATKFNGKTEQKTIDDTAIRLGLTFDQIKSAVAKAKANGAWLDWDETKCPLYDSTKPSAPEVTLSNKSNGIRADWNKVSGATKYVVYYKKSADSNWSSVETKNNYYPLLDLTVGIEYSVQVKPVVSGAGAVYSKVKKLVYIPQVKPTVTLSNKSNGIRADWNKVDGATKYAVYYKKNYDSNWSYAETQNNYYPLLNLTAGTTYNVQIQPVFGSKNGLYSAVASLCYVPQVKPTLTLSNKSNGIRADWNKVAGAIKYNVYYKNNADSTWTSTVTSNNYYPLLNLTAGVQYAVQVQPVFGNANGAYSAVSRLVYVPQVKPTVTLSNKSNGIRAEWNAMAGTTKYVVYYRKNADANWSSTETKNNYYPLLNIVAGTQYAVQVQPVYNTAKGLYSAVSRLVYVPQVKPTVTLSNKSNGIRAEWNAMAGATKYIVYFRKDADSQWSSAETTNNYYPLLNITADTKYAVQVQPVFNGSKGLYSAVARLVYQPLITKPTVTLTKSSTGIKANWNAVSGATKYIVYFRKSGDAWSSSEVTATSAEFKNLTKGNQYLVQVQPVIGSKKGDYSKVASITF